MSPENEIVLECIIATILGLIICGVYVYLILLS